MVDKDSRSSSVGRTKDLEDRLEVIDAFEELDRNAGLGQILAPDVLDELGVMASLHPDARALGDLRTAVSGREGSGVRNASSGCAHLLTRRGLSWSRSRRQRIDGATLEPEPRPQGKGTAYAPAVFKLDEVDTARLLHARHGANPAGGHVFEDHADLDVDGLRARTPRSRTVAMRVVSKDVAAVRV